MYTANNRDDTASVIDTTSHTVTATVKVGTNPWGVAIDPTTRAATWPTSGITASR
jgi:serine/threonine protein kinase, bacterial